MMSHWDFGRPTAGEHDAPRPSGPAGAAYPPDLPGGAGPAPDAWPPQDAWPTDGGWQRQDGWPADDGRAAENAWAAHQGLIADERRSPAEGWPPGGDRSPDTGWPADDGWDGDDGTAQYPITYERDDFAVADPQPAGEAREPWEPWPPAPFPGEPREADASGPAGYDTGGQAQGAWRRGTAGRQDTEAAATGWTGRDLGLPGEADWAGGGARRGGRRWLIPAGIVVAGAAVGAAAVVLNSGHPGGQRAGGFVAPSATPSARASARTSAAPSPSPAVPLTMTQAKGVLAGYTTVNNGANAQRSGTLLATVGSGSSYAIDAGLYQAQQAAGAAPYPAFAAAAATYYIPRDEPAAGPRWFVVQVANAFNSDPKKVTSDEYLLFTQSAAGGAWQDTIEPYRLSGASAPQIEVGADGLASAVSPDAASVTVAPGQLPAATAASLDGTGAGAGQAAVADPGNLADRGDQRLWQGKVPGGSVTDTHAPATGADGQEFALLTADGGALVFYTDTAELTITPPAGSALHLTVPGFYSPAQALSRAGVSYLEQFAAYDPPAAAGGAPRVVADYSGITGKN